jgi:DNA polymerase III alpha subunit
MSETRSNTEVADQNIERIKQEIRNHSVKITPPDINKSDMTYKLQPDGSLLTGLDALKSVGDEAIQDILNKRPFKSFHEFITKVDTRQVRSTTIQSLCGSGCLDSFGLTRKAMYLYCSDYRKRFREWSKKHDSNTETFIYDWPESSKVEWSKPELYALEKSFIGEGFACKKVEAYGGFFNKQCTPIKNIRLMKGKDNIPSIICEVKSLYELLVKKETSKQLGQPMIKAVIEDANGDQIPLTIFPEQWKKTKARIKDLCGNRYKFEEGLVLHFSGTVNVYEDNVGVVLQDIYSICPPPPLPKDLEHKKIAKMREPKVGWGNKAPKVEEEKQADFDQELFDDLEDDENDDNNENW